MDNLFYMFGPTAPLLAEKYLVGEYVMLYVDGDVRRYEIVERTPRSDGSVYIVVEPS